jgi:D-xylose reductase
MDDAGNVETDKVPIRETWEAMEEVVDHGIARSIGVSNFQAQSIYDILSYARHPLSALQIEHHPYLVQGELVQVAQENGIAVTAYSSFGPQSFVELPAVFSEKAKDISLLFDAGPVKILAAKYNVTPAQVLLRWATQRYVPFSPEILVFFGIGWDVDTNDGNSNVAVIPKSNNQSRLAQNLDVLGFDMTADEIKSIAALDKGLRFNDPGHYLPNHPIRIFA